MIQMNHFCENSPAADTGKKCWKHFSLSNIISRKDASLGSDKLHDSALMRHFGTCSQHLSVTTWICLSCFCLFSIIWFIVSFVSVLAVLLYSCFLSPLLMFMCDLSPSTARVCVCTIRLYPGFWYLHWTGFTSRFLEFPAVALFA